MQLELKTTAPGNYCSNSQDAAQGCLEVGNIFQVSGSLNSCVFGLFLWFTLKNNRSITLKIGSIIGVPSKGHQCIHESSLVVL